MILSQNIELYGANFCNKPNTKITIKLIAHLCISETSYIVSQISIDSKNAFTEVLCYTFFPNQ